MGVEEEETKAFMEILAQMWSLLGFLTVIQNILPTPLLSFLHSLYETLSDRISPYVYFDVPEFNGYCGVDLNHLYRHVSLYLSSLHHHHHSRSSSSASCRRLTLSRSSASSFSFAVAPNHSVSDSFLGHSLSWTHHVDTLQDSLDEKRSFTLKLPKRHRHSLLIPYLRHVTSSGENFERLSSDRRLFTNNGQASTDSGWVSVPFRHPSTFDTLALEPQLKKQITEDLAAFADGKEWYQSVGRAWKRGYFLHGPPGSGKSSLIAAMANYLRYDVYDLELTKVTDNSELRALLIQTKNRSIIVIEDIDCSVDLTTERLSKPPRHQRYSQGCGGGSGEEDTGRVTLSGLLNFTDGLWSCCGDERIIVFTTNHPNNVDPALVRCGRMDVHISLGACGVHAFRVMAKNYLGIDSHALFDAVERCVKSGCTLTPAQVGEILLRNRRDADVAMREVVAAMQAKILGEGIGREVAVEYDEQAAAAAAASPQSVLVVGSPENWGGSSRRGKAGGGKRRKDSLGSHITGEKKLRLLLRLRSLTKSDSGRRAV